jgi:hypothetical protein
MDFTNHPYRNIDNRSSRINKVNQSIIDNYTSKLRHILSDDSIDERFIAKVVQNLSESDINDFADYAVRKANNPGRAFVKLCYNAMQFKTL